jgi:hypothetical protein
MVKIGLKAVGQSFSNCYVSIDKIAPPLSAGVLPIQLKGGDFMLRHDDPEHFVTIATHWSHVDQFSFNLPNRPGGFLAPSSSPHNIHEGTMLTISIKITGIQNNGSEFSTNALFEIWTDESRKLHLKRI